MGDADCCGFGYARTADGCIFELDGADPFAARFNHVLCAIGNLYRPVGMDRGHIPRIDPLSTIAPVVVLLEVPSADRRSARLKLACALAVARKHSASIV